MYLYAIFDTFSTSWIRIVKRSTRQTFVVQLGVFEVIETVILEETSQMDTESVKKFRYLGFRFNFWQNFDQVVYNVSVQQKSNWVFNWGLGEMMLVKNNFHDEKKPQNDPKRF